VPLASAVVTTARVNRQVVLAKRPVGMVTESCFETVETPVPELGEGEALLEVRYLGIDPTIRGWLDERGNYMAGVAIGEPVRSNGVGVVIETNNPAEYPLGRAFMHLTGWQQYCVVQSNPFPPITMVPEGVELIDVLGVLGHIGITAYVGVLEVAKPIAGETFCVSAAASSVGSIAGQIAKMQGARVIGIAGSPEKCAWVVDELGFDACIDYKRDDVAARLKALVPRGVDVFFDNVGGELLDTVLRRLAMHARVVLCGDISTYNLEGPPTPLHNVRYLMGKRARMEGFNTLDHWDHYAEAAAQLAQWLAAGRIKARVHELDGLGRAPEALVRLFTGDHLGKLVVRL
jgi:NADPH-dependent curcumin reductase CurA